MSLHGFSMLLIGFSWFFKMIERHERLTFMNERLYLDMIYQHQSIFNVSHFLFGWNSKVCSIDLAKKKKNPAEKVRRTLSERFS